MLLLMALAGCLRNRVSARIVPPSIDDSIGLVYVRHLDGPTFEVGKPAHLLVRLEYTLDLYDSARLSLSLEQFSSNPNTCSAAGELVKTIPVHISSEDAIPIFRGTHTVEIPVTWSGNPGAGSDGRPIKTGVITFQSSMVTDVSHYKFLTRSFGSEYCVRF